MKIKTSELTGAALDWAVAKCEGNEISIPKGYLWIPTECYATYWQQGGPIIEREGIALYLYGGSEWNAHVGGRESVGPTPLIAAMRCYVAAKWNHEVEIPEELK